MVTPDTSVQDLMALIAAEERIPLERMQSITKKLQDEWFDTLASMQHLSIEDFQKMGIPTRISAAITRKFPSTPPAPPSVDLLESLYRSIPDPSDLTNCVQTCQVILNNILMHPTDSRLWEIKLNNRKFAEKVGRFPLAVAFLEQSGFRKDEIALKITNIDFDRLKKALEELNSFALRLNIPAKTPEIPPEVPFNPYKSVIISINSEVPRLTSREHDPAIFTSQLQALAQAKEAVIRQEAVPRNPVIYHLPPDLQVKSEDFEAIPEDVITPEEENLMLRNMQSILRMNEENSKFQNRRKRQLELETRRKVYAKVTVRVKFPDSVLLQGSFSALETNVDLYQFVQTMLRDQNRRFYLYMTPPKVRIKPVRQEKLEAMAPASIVYFAWDQESNR